MSKLSVFLMVVTICLSGAAAIASEPTWEEIQSNPSLYAELPQVAFGNIVVPVTALCVDGENLRPNNPVVEQCVAWGHAPEYPCVETKSVYPSTPITYQAEECISRTNANYSRSGFGDCLKSRTVTVTRQLSFDIDVYQNTRVNFDRGGRPLFTKTFTIPECR